MTHSLKPRALDLAALTQVGPVVAEHAAAAIKQYVDRSRIGMQIPEQGLMRLAVLLADRARGVGSSELTTGHGGSPSAAPAAIGDAEQVVVERALLTRREVAATAGVSESTVKRDEAAGRLAAVRYGRRVRYRIAEVQRWMDGESDDAERSAG